MQAEKKEQKNKKGAHGKKPQGVAYSLVVLLVLLALVCGGVLGYLGGSRFSKTARDLKQAQADLSNYELTMAELYTDEVEDLGLVGSDGTFPDENGNAALQEFVVEDTTEAQDPVVVAEFNGGVVMSDEAYRAYEEMMSDDMMGGMDVAESGEMVVDIVLENLVSEGVARAKAEELGYTAYTAADEDKIDRDAQTQYDETVLFFADFLRDGEMTDEEAVAEAQEYLEMSEGYTLDSVRAAVSEEYWQNKLYDHVVESVSVSQDDITLLYNEQEKEQEERFKADPAAFDEALAMGELLLYQPEGYRAVKQIFFALDDDSAWRAEELRQLLETTEDEAEKETLNAELEGLYEALEAQAAEVMAELKNGGDFDQLMAEYSDDLDLNQGAYSDTGYYVTAGSDLWPESFVTAAMALAAPGDYSEPVRSENGVHIVRYVSDVEAGAVPLSKINQELTAETLEAMQFEAYQEQLQVWMNEAEVKYYPDRLYFAD